MGLNARVEVWAATSCLAPMAATPHAVVARAVMDLVTAKAAGAAMVEAYGIKASRTRSWPRTAWAGTKCKRAVDWGAIFCHLAQISCERRFFQRVTRSLWARCPPKSSPWSICQRFRFYSCRLYTEWLACHGLYIR